MSRFTSSAVRPEAGTPIRITNPDDSIEEAVIERRLGQYLFAHHPRAGGVRWHLLDDRIKGRRGAWRAQDLLIELAE